MLLIFGMVRFKSINVNLFFDSVFMVFCLFVVLVMLYFKFCGSEWIILCFDNLELLVINIEIDIYSFLEWYLMWCFFSKVCVILVLL